MGSSVIRRNTKTTHPLTWITRMCLLSLTVGAYIYYDSLQSVVDRIYNLLLSTWVFNCVYFETWWALLSYVIVLAPLFTIHKIKYFNKFKIDVGISWQDAGVITIILEMIEYSFPVMILDTFIVKKYHGVDPQEWNIRRNSWIQYTRALPDEAPTPFQLFYQLVISIVLFDVMFYCIHKLLHKNMWLYKNLHACHHEHEFIHGRITNKLTILERTALVLAANQALKFINGHPLTRFVFVPVFQYLLVENHCGYEFPWGTDKILPFGVAGGSKYHHLHHTKGSQNYQPFFTYIDRWVNHKMKS